LGTFIPGDPLVGVAFQSDAALTFAGAAAAAGGVAGGPAGFWVAATQPKAERAREREIETVGRTRLAGVLEVRLFMDVLVVGGAIPLFMNGGSPAVSAGGRAAT
jgi:hypothetical protein